MTYCLNNSALSPAQHRLFQSNHANRDRSNNPPEVSICFFFFFLIQSQSQQTLKTFSFSPLLAVLWLMKFKHFSSPTADTVDKQCSKARRHICLFNGSLSAVLFSPETAVQTCNFLSPLTVTEGLCFPCFLWQK